MVRQVVNSLLNLKINLEDWFSPNHYWIRRINKSISLWVVTNFPTASSESKILNSVDNPYVFQSLQRTRSNLFYNSFLIGTSEEWFPAFRNNNSINYISLKNGNLDFLEFGSNI